MSGEGDDFEFDEQDMRAAEFALGVLEGEERRAAYAQRDRDPAFRTQVDDWSRRLYPLTEAIRPVVPPPELWPRIRESVSARAAAPDLAPGIIKRAWRSPGLWRATTAASLAVAASLAAFILVRTQAPPETRLVATIAPLNAPAAFLADIRPGGTVVLTALNPAAVPSDRDLQLWSLPRGATAPTSLGLLRLTGGPVVVPAVVPEGGQLLVSLEPLGGSPTGLPTGPVLYGGTITRFN